MGTMNRWWALNHREERQTTRKRSGWLVPAKRELDKSDKSSKMIRGFFGPVLFGLAECRVELFLSGAMSDVRRGPGDSGGRIRLCGLPVESTPDRAAIL